MSDSTPSSRIAILGFGFSGLMVLAHVLRETTRPLTLYVIDPSPDGLGLAYRTAQPQHLLNVPAGRMGAWADQPEDFFVWLSSAAGNRACQTHGLTIPYTSEDFVPRLLYGEYLQSIWQQAQAVAAQKSCRIAIVPSYAVALPQEGAELHVLTARGDAIAVDAAIVAVGNHSTPLYPHLPQDHLIQTPGDEQAIATAAATSRNIAILGTGLTAVDTIMSLRAHGYTGPITALSRHGWLPRAHAEHTIPYAWQRDELLDRAATPSQLIHCIRQRIRAQHNDWRAIIDGLRPHSQVLWRRFTVRDQQRILKRVASMWGVHRHRMAPQIAALLEAEINTGNLQIAAAHELHITTQEGRYQLQWQSMAGPQTISVDTLINCRGLTYSLTQASNPLLRYLIENGLVEAHATGLGIATDAHLLAYGHAYGKLYALGGILTGQYFETLAVPELRVQAHRIARHLLGNA